MISAAATAAAEAHALGAFPSESCGLVAAGRYIPLPNVSPVPGRHFAIRDADFFDARRKGPIEAVIHSHTTGNAFPGISDMRGQISSGVPWGIIVCNGEQALPPFFWGDSLPIPPLLGRSFRHGPSGTDGKGDCFALGRDWFRMNRGVTLRDVPRAYEWWDETEKNADLLEAGYLSQGFRQVASPEPGDGFIMRIPPRAPVYNHCGIFLEGGLILHHLRNRLSTREPAAVWADKFQPLWLRYRG